MENSPPYFFHSIVLHILRLTYIFGMEKDLKINTCLPLNIFKLEKIYNFSPNIEKIACKRRGENMKKSHFLE